MIKKRSKHHPDSIYRARYISSFSRLWVSSNSTYHECSGRPSRGGFLTYPNLLQTKARRFQNIIFFTQRTGRNRLVNNGSNPGGHVRRGRWQAGIYLQDQPMECRNRLINLLFLGLVFQRVPENDRWQWSSAMLLPVWLSGSPGETTAFVQLFGRY